MEVSGRTESSVSCATDAEAVESEVSAGMGAEEGAEVLEGRSCCGGEERRRRLGVGDCGEDCRGAWTVTRLVGDDEDERPRRLGAAIM